MGSFCPVSRSPCSQPSRPGCRPEALGQTVHTQPGWVGCVSRHRNAWGRPRVWRQQDLTWPHLPSPLHVSYQGQAGQPHPGVFGALAGCGSPCRSGREGVREAPGRPTPGWRLRAGVQQAPRAPGLLLPGLGSWAGVRSRQAGRERPAARPAGRPWPQLPRWRAEQARMSGRRARPNFLCLNYTGPNLPNPPALSAAGFPSPRQPPASQQPFPSSGLGGGLEGRPQPEKEASPTLGTLPWVGGVSEYSCPVRLSLQGWTL